MNEQVAGDGECYILVAEDDESLRSTIAELLRTERHHVVEAGDGEAALRVLRDRAFDVLVLDLHMPRMNGFQLLDTFDFPPPSVIVYSAFEYFDVGDVERRLGTSVRASLQKPVPPAVLISAVESACSEH
jgi:CheY-like chemotaxis protein